MPTHPPSCPYHFLDLSEPGPDACCVVPLVSARLSLEAAQRIAETCMRSTAMVAISDGCRVAYAGHPAALLALRGRTFEVECSGPDAHTVMSLVAQHLRGLHGTLGPRSSDR